MARKYRSRVLWQELKFNRFIVTLGKLASEYLLHSEDYKRHLYIFMKILHLILAFWIIGNFLLGNAASAHSFNLVFIAPISDTVGRALLDGFLLATTEQDSHEFETSDGHLGGLDSHVFKVDNAAGQAMTAAQLEKIIGEAEPLFATGLLLDAYQMDLLKNSGTVFVDPTSSRFWSDRLAHHEQLTTMNGGFFFDAFENAYDYQPDIHAIRGYLAARVIADVIRNSSERDRSSPPVLDQMVGAALVEPSW